MMVVIKDRSDRGDQPWSQALTSCGGKTVVGAGSGD
jgi:hypothetical protein